MRRYGGGIALEGVLVRASGRADMMLLGLTDSVSRGYGNQPVVSSSCWGAWVTCGGEPCITRGWKGRHQEPDWWDLLARIPCVEGCPCPPLAPLERSAHQQRAARFARDQRNSGTNTFLHPDKMPDTTTAADEIVVLRWRDILLRLHALDPEIHKLVL